jgi:SAM-dependent methyltransferase
MSPVSWIALAAVLWLGFVAFVQPALRRETVTVAVNRNFYGVLRVSDDAPLPGAMRRLRHGRITHGTQFLDSTRRTEPTAYYAHGSGVDLAIRQHRRRRAREPLTIGAVGLGAGTIATYASAGDSVRFYEINRDVVEFAERHFSYLRDSEAAIDVVLGDARLALEREMGEERNRGRYDVMVVDAFSGDAVPVHLLTMEAMILYWQALRPDGVLAVHVSNRHLDLSRVVHGAAREGGRRVVRVRRNAGTAALASTWLLVSRDVEFFTGLDVPAATGVDLPLEDPVVWTDQYSNLLGVLQ